LYVLENAACAAEISGGIQLLVLSSLYEATAGKQADGWRSVRQRLTDCTKESLAFLILKFPRLKYRQVFVITSALVLVGLAAEHSPAYGVMALGGFLAALGDDALQVRTNALMQERFPSEQRATLTSVSSFAFSVVMIVLSPLAGILFTYW